VRCVRKATPHAGVYKTFSKIFNDLSPSSLHLHLPRPIAIHARVFTLREGLWEGLIDSRLSSYVRSITVAVADRGGSGAAVRAHTTPAVRACALCCCGD
jgi:hypothetical protein